MNFFFYLEGNTVNEAKSCRLRTRHREGKGVFQHLPNSESETDQGSIKALAEGKVDIQVTPGAQIDSALDSNEGCKHDLEAS